MTQSQIKTSSIYSRSDIRATSCVVIKLGSALISTSSENVLDSIATQIDLLKKRGVQVVIVSSGAVAIGRSILGYKTKPTETSIKQACAAAGQAYLMSKWIEVFERKNLHVAQLLLTKTDITERESYNNLRKTLDVLLKKEIIPIINENDAIVCNSTRIGNNDRLSAEISGVVFSPLMVLLTSTNGIFDDNPTQNPDAARISTLFELKESTKVLSKKMSSEGTGGVITKLEAAAIARLHGVATFVASGYEPNILLSIFEGEDIGTLIPCVQESVGSAKKRWIAGSSISRGVLYIDAGAYRAILGNASLLFPGVKKIDGDFSAGDILDIYVEGTNQLVARGVSSFRSDDAKQVFGKSASYRRKNFPHVPDELVHRDGLVVFEMSKFLVVNGE